MDDVKRYGDKLWDMANGVTGFSALQGAAVSLVKWDVVSRNVNAIYTATVLEILTTGLYFFSVYKLETYHIRCIGQSGPLPKIFQMVGIGRKFVIIWFGLLAWLALLGGYNAK